MRCLKILLIVALFLSSKGYGQDIHFSSTSFNPMFYNPAMTAFSNEKFRFSTIYRNQWQTISPGYNTFFSALEFQPYFSSANSMGIGLGISFANDVAGSLSYGERDFAISSSFFKSLDRNDRTYLSIGVAVMHKNWSYDISAIQFNPNNIYDDNITYDNLNTFDANLGFSFQYAKDEQHLFSIGASIFHLNTPSFTYIKDNENYIHRRIFTNISYLFPIKNSENLTLNPKIFFSHQHNYSEILAGTDLNIKLIDAIFTTQILSCGLYMRNLDAIIISPSFRYNNFFVGMSYDVNISRLNKVSHTYGGVELWISYSFSPYYSNQKQTKIPCPIF